MTDIDLSRDLRPDVPLAGAAQLTAVRDRLTAEISAERDRPGRTGVTARPGHAVTRGGRPGRRVLTATAITAAAAAAAAIVAMTSSGGGRQRIPAR
ncbi:MAG: hypothetical protein ACRDPO_07955 [Streptosporangiaceae bacterium]